MNGKGVVVALMAFALLGCGMSDQEIRQKTGDAAVGVKHAAENAGDTLKKAYDDAAAKGKRAMQNAGAKATDEVLKAKVIAGFDLVSGLDASKIKVDVKEGKVTLSGTVKSQMEKYKAEGVAYGVTGDTSKFESSITVE